MASKDSTIYGQRLRSDERAMSSESDGIDSQNANPNNCSLISWNSGTWRVFLCCTPSTRFPFQTRGPNRKNFRDQLHSLHHHLFLNVALGDLLGLGRQKGTLVFPLENR